MSERGNMLLGLRELQNLPPTFFIGLGGSGSRVVDTLARRLRREPSWERFRGLIHFVAIDTDQSDLDRISERCETSNISLTNKRRRIQLLRGELEHEENERAVSWIHPWYEFRDTSGKGAGQIRLESRFSLHCQIADGRPGNVRGVLHQRLSSALAAHNPSRDRTRPVRFYFYGSLAGGTGSGTFITLAYLVRQLAAELGSPSQVYGTYFLPSVFREKVSPPLHSKINANAYAALLELERVMELRYEGTGPNKIELVYDPQLSQGRAVDPRVDKVDRPPYDWVYLADLPEAMTVDQITAAAGEAAYLQLFSPILAFQEREGDNFEQLQSEPNEGFFALQYGSIGASVLELPRERLVRYFARRQCVELLDRYVVGNAKAEDGDGVDWSDKAFQKLSEEEQNRLIDAGFVSFIAQQADLEAHEQVRGIFTEIKELRSAATNVLDRFRERLREELEKAEALIDLMAVQIATITPENPSLNTARTNLRRDFHSSKQKLDAESLVLQKAIQSGQFLTRFFRDYKVSPLLQRFLLLRVSELARNEGLRSEDEALLDWCFIPYESAEDGAHLAGKPLERSLYHVEEPTVRKMIKDREDALRGASEKWLGKDKAFSEAAFAALGLFNKLERDTRDALLIDFWHQISRSLQHQVEKRLSVFRVIARKGRSRTRHLLAQAEQCRDKGLEVPAVGALPDENTTFHLGHEVFHDARTATRQWDSVYRLRVQGEVKLEPQAVLDAVNGVLERHSASRTADERESDTILDEIADALDGLSRAKIAPFLAHESPMNLASGLELEARIAVASRRGTLATARLADLAAIPEADLEPYLRDKLDRVASMSRSLGRFDEAVISGSRIPAYPPRFFGIEQRLLEGNGLLKRVFLSAVEGFDALEDWESGDLLSFYQATLGVPLYCYLELLQRLEPDYRHELTTHRKHPLHIDHRWEREGFHGAPGPGLPSLLLSDRRAWEQARKDEALQRARAAADALQAASEGFALNLAAGHIVDQGGLFALTFMGRSRDLDRGLVAAMAAFAALDEPIRTTTARQARAAIEASPAALAAARAALEKIEGAAAWDGRPDEVEAARTLLATLGRLGAPGHGGAA